jgi:hypothetical protein
LIEFFLFQVFMERPNLNSLVIDGANCCENAAALR